MQMFPLHGLMSMKINGNHMLPSHQISTQVKNYTRSWNGVITAFRYQPDNGLTQRQRPTSLWSDMVQLATLRMKDSPVLTQILRLILQFWTMFSTKETSKWGNTVVSLSSRVWRIFAVEHWSGCVETQQSADIHPVCGSFILKHVFI